MEEVSIKMFVRKNEDKSNTAKKIIKELVIKMPFIKLNIIDLEEDPITPLTYQVFKSPSVCINGVMRFHGVVPEEGDLKYEIDRALQM